MITKKIQTENCKWWGGEMYEHEQNDDCLGDVSE